MSDIFNNRETRIEFSGLIREMCDMLDHLAPEIDDDFADDRIEAEKLIARAKALLNETAQPAGGESADEGVTESHRIGREAALDEAWEEVNALYKNEFISRIQREPYHTVLRIIEKLGGMDPLQRSRK